MYKILFQCLLDQAPLKLDFKKGYGLVDEESVFQVLRVKGLDFKNLAIITETLTSAILKVKFVKSSQNHFKKICGVKQGDVQSPLLFSCIMEKVM